jgi:2-amino-4-hydroxy-6-hydroxymethyldihydropteridine diphosphokinase
MGKNILYMSDYALSNVNKVVIALGSNIGDYNKHFEYAIEQLTENKVHDIVRSSIYLTKPIDCVEGTPDFYNMVVIGDYYGSPAELLEVTKQIEIDCGRPADHSSDEARTLDLDIILFGDWVVNTPDLVIPHPRAAERAFVLAPLAELNENFKFPDSKKTCKQLLDELE